MTEVIDIQTATSSHHCKIPDCTGEAVSNRGRFAGLCRIHIEAQKQRQGRVSLDEEIERLLNLGESDPLEAARKLTRQHTDEWLKDQLAMYAEDILAEMFRRRLGSVRRKAEVALHPGDAMADAEFKIAKTWVPGYGWMKAADLTSDHLRAKAAWYDKAAVAALRRARWCDTVAGMMDAEGAETLADLKVELPALPDEDILELVA